MGNSKRGFSSVTIRPEHCLFMFGLPRRKQNAIFLSLILSVLAIIMFLLSLAELALDVLFWVFVLIYTAHLYIAVGSLNYNVFALFRYLLLWSLCAIAAITRVVWQGEVYLGPFGPEYQTDGNLVIILTSGVLAISGSLIGWNASMNVRQGHALFCTNIKLSSSQRLFLRTFGLILAVGAGLLYLWGAGGMVSEENVYGTAGTGLGFEFNVLNVFQYIGISALLLSAIEINRFSKSSLILVIFSLILGMLAGSRADYLPQSLIVCLLFFNPRINKAIVELKISTSRFILLTLVFSSVFYLSATIIAHVRQGFPLFELVQRSFSTGRGLINEVYGYPVLFFETGNMMIGGFYAAIVNVEKNGLLFGQGYFDYLLRSPPAFLGLDRPAGLDTLTIIDGQIMSQGGIFEIAEAYWNFGFLGCFLVPLLLSYLHGSILKNAIKNGSLFLLICYLVPGFMAFRAIWYQNFSYFRQVTILIILYVFAHFFVRWALAQRRRRYSVGRDGPHCATLT